MCRWAGQGKRNINGTETAHTLYPKLHIPEMRQIHRRNKDRHNMLKQKLATGIPVEHVDLWDRHGVDAAEHLYALIRNHS